MTESVSPLKAGYKKKRSKFDKSEAILTKKKTQITNIRNERQDITIGPIDIN